MKPARSLLPIHVLMLLALTSTILLGGMPGRVASANDLPIYTDAFAAGWDPNWSYQNPLIDPNNAAPVHAGTKSIKVTYTAAAVLASPAFRTALQPSIVQPIPKTPVSKRHRRSSRVGSSTW